jgi:hypothetical protein
MIHLPLEDSRLMADILMKFWRAKHAAQNSILNRPTLPDHFKDATITLRTALRTMRKECAAMHDLLSGLVVKSMEDPTFKIRFDRDIIAALARELDIQLGESFSLYQPLIDDYERYLTK